MNEQPSFTASREQRVIRVFVSSTFRDMQAERDHLVKFVFPQLRKLCESRGVTWGEVDLRWGITEEQSERGEVVSYCLEEIDRCRPYFIGLLGDYYGTLAHKVAPDLKPKEGWPEDSAERSITELEIIYGVLANPQMTDRAFFYFRDPAYAWSLPEEQRRAFLNPDPVAESKLTALKERIRQRHHDGKLKVPPRDNYRNPEVLGRVIRRDFTRLINTLFPADQQPDPLDHEAASHEAYAQSRRLAFVGREDLLHRLNEHAFTAGKPLVLTGNSGCGKSALLAEWVAHWRKEHPDDLIIQHYTGSTPDSADWQRLVRRILGEFKRTFDIPDDLPLQPEVLRTALNDWTVKAAGSRRVVLVLDALNQLADDDAAQQLGWLPIVFPANFCVVVSSLPGESLEAIRRRSWSELNVPLFAQADIMPAALAYFKVFSKTPSPDILTKLESTQAACNALYLRAVLDELRQFGKHEELQAKAADYLSSPDLPTLFNRILTRWHDDFGKDPEHPDLVRRSLCLIACARFGLSEAELLDLLGKKDDQGRDEPLPRRFWTPFYLAAENALAVRAGLLNFGHDYLRDTVHNRYLSESAVARNYHLRIGAYFWGDQRSGWWSAPLGTSTVNRVLDEVPWQLAESESYEMLCMLLSHLPFLSAACDRAPLDVRRYWVRLEKRSQFRLTEVYRGVFEAPEDHRPYLRTLASLLTASGNVVEASKLLTYEIDSLRSKSEADALVAPILELAANFYELGDFRRALSLLEEAEQICRNSLDDHDLGQVLGEQAPIYHRLGKLNRALELLAKQEEISRKSGAKGALAACLANQASIYLDKGDSLRALALSHQVEGLRRELGDLHGLADSLNTQALAHYALKEWAKAKSLLAKQRKICRTIGHLGGLADGLSVSAKIEQACGRKSRAKKYLAIATTLNGSLERKFKLAANLEQIAQIFEEEKLTEDAADALGQSLLYFSEAQDAKHAAAVGLRHAIVLSTLQRHQEALSSLDLVIRLNPTSDGLGARLQAARAEILLALGKPQAALDSLNVVPLPILEDEKGLKGPIHALRSKALRELGRTDESLAAVQVAEDSLEAEGALALLVEALILHARILIFDSKTPAGAASVLDRARAIAAAQGLTNGLERIEPLLDRVNQQTGGRLQND